ncbi:Bacterial membrane flanked domain protein [Thiorhodovibrio winogradskyi]|uniref:Bacterial membrane flanked domain protein n=2 Tax=Thiorhodovibrio winogradskyi TaxID=77007 RepID=A0ABZ0SEQ3_9GAMM
MSEILYQANPSVWRMRPMGTIIAWLMLAGGLLIGLTGNLPYLETLYASFPALHGWQLQPRFLARYAGYGIAAIGAFNLLRWWLTCLVDQLEIYPNEIIWTHGLLAKNYTEINMGSVRTVQVHQSLLQRLVGAGDLLIFTTGDEPELAVHGLPRPNEIREHIRQRASTAG